jgi:hypothetical protein
MNTDFVSLKRTEAINKESKLQFYKMTNYLIEEHLELKIYYDCRKYAKQEDVKSKKLDGK